MLNDDIMDDKEREIYRLNRCIKAFKKYDEDRKKYLRKIQDELEVYSEKYLQLKKALSSEDRTLVESYEERLLTQRRVVSGLNRKLHTMRLLDALKDDKEQLAAIEELVAHCTKTELSAKIEELKAECTRLRDVNKELVLKIMSLQNKLNEHENQSTHKD